MRTVRCTHEMTDESVTARLSEQFRGLVAADEVKDCVAAARSCLRLLALDSPGNALVLARATIELRLSRDRRKVRVGIAGPAE